MLFYTIPLLPLPTASCSSGSVHAQHHFCAHTYSKSHTAVPVPLYSPPITQIILRKGYHLVAAALFLPAFFWDLPLLCISLAIAFAVLAAAEVARCMRVPLLGEAIQGFMQVRGRDHGMEWAVGL